MWYLLSIIIEHLFCMFIDVFMLLISICFLLKDGLRERFDVYTLTVQQAVLNTYYFESRIQIGHLSYAGKALVVVLYLVFLRYTFMFKRQPIIPLAQSQDIISNASLAFFFDLFCASLVLYHR